MNGEYDMRLARNCGVSSQVTYTFSPLNQLSEATTVLAGLAQRPEQHGRSPPSFALSLSRSCSPYLPCRCLPLVLLRAHPRGVLTPPPSTSTVCRVHLSESEGEAAEASEGGDTTVLARPEYLDSAYLEGSSLTMELPYMVCR